MLCALGFLRLLRKADYCLYHYCVSGSRVSKRIRSGWDQLRPGSVSSGRCCCSELQTTNFLLTQIPGKLSNAPGRWLLFAHNCTSCEQPDKLTCDKSIGNQQPHRRQTTLPSPKAAEALTTDYAPNTNTCGEVRASTCLFPEM